MSVQMLLSRPDMVKPTSQVQRVEPKKCVQLEGRMEEEEGKNDVGDETELAEGGDVEEEDADRAAETGKEEAAEENEAKELEVLLRGLHMGCWPLHFRESRHTLVLGPISS